MTAAVACSADERHTAGGGSDAGRHDASAPDATDAGRDGADASRDASRDDGDDGGDDGGDPGERPSGRVDVVRQGEPLEVDQARREAARAAFEELDKAELEQGFSPADLYAIFNEFALTHFGPANQPLLHEHTGRLLDYVPGGEWRHVSATSATVAFETTLPVLGSVEYGTSPDDLSASTGESERYFFTQVHHLSDLRPGTTYYYRLVGRAASGETIVSHLDEFTTADAAGTVALPGALDGPPYLLDEPSTTYVLTEDIVADATAIHVAASDVTLDLNGHRIVYANAPVAAPDVGQAETAATGVWARGSDLVGVRVVNGTIEEGHVGNAGGDGVHAVYLSGVDGVELAGLSIAYHAAQAYAVVLDKPSGRVHLHHNNFVDRGFEILDRHGAGGGRPVHISDSSAQARIENDYELDHNLVKRTRQNGLPRANTIRRNEIFVDSWSTNSFAIQPHSTPDTVAGEVRGNRLFLTGYHAIALGWAHLDLVVEDNLVQLEGVRTDRRRYYEDWGDMDSLNGFRITNFGSGGQVRDNLAYRGNTIVGRARSGGIMRGTEFFSDATITNTVFEDNFVQMMSEDDQTLDVAAVVTQGVHDTRPDHRPTSYVGNRLVSNLANVRFGDSYGRGNRHTFIGTTFVKVGDHPDYHTFVFDGGYSSYDHAIIDPVFEGGARVDDVWWRRTSVSSYYTVKWTVSVEGEAGAAVTIEDVDGEQVFSGQLDEQGVLEVPLAEVTIRPAEWTEGASGGVDQRLESQKIAHTPHTITVGDQTQTVTVDAAKAVTF